MGFKSFENLLNEDKNTINNFIFYLIITNIPIIIFLPSISNQFDYLPQILIRILSSFFSILFLVKNNYLKNKYIDIYSYLLILFLLPFTYSYFVFLYNYQPFSVLQLSLSIILFYMIVSDKKYWRYLIATILVSYIIFVVTKISIKIEIYKINDNFNNWFQIYLSCALILYIFYLVKISKRKTLYNKEQVSILLSAVGHDLISPLSRLIIMLNSITKSIKDNDTKIAVEGLYLVINLVRNIKKDCRIFAFNVKSINFIDSGDFKLKNINISSIVRGVVEEFKKSNENAKFIINEEADLIVLGEEMLLRHLFMNIINNSIKHSNINALIINIIIEDKKVIIMDNGRGMNVKKINKHLSNMRNLNSKGIGLIVSKIIMIAHSGEILFESKLNEYAKIILKF